MATLEQLAERSENEREWRREMRHDMDKLDTKVDRLDTKMNWLIGLFITSMVGIAFALVRLFAG